MLREILVSPLSRTDQDSLKGYTDGLKLQPETTVYSDRLSLHYPPISDAFDNIDNFFCIKQMIQY